MPDLWMDVDTALAEVPVNIMPLLDDTDFKSRETGVAYNAGGMDLVWNFVTTGGAFTQTAVTPTTGGNYDWAHQGDGMYSIEIPASGGASINNDTEGFGWFTGVATGVLPWRGPIIGFRAAGLNDKMVDSAYSTTRGLAGTALPDAAADAAGGLPISDAGGLDLDAQIGTDIDAILVDTSTTLDDLIDDLETRIGTPSNLGSGATIAANLVDIEGQTDDIGAAGAGLTALATAAELAKVPKSDGTASWNATALAAIQSEATDALNAYDPPTRAELTTDKDSIITEVNANETKIDTLTTYVDTEVAAIKAKTDNLPASPANEATLTTIVGYLDTEIAAILADTNELQTDLADGGRLDLLIDAILADTSTDGVVLANDAITAAKVAADAIGSSELAGTAVDKILDEVIEGSLTMRQALRLFLAVLVGKSAGGGTTEITFRDNGDSLDRVTATVDNDGNRTAVTLNAS